MKYDKLFTGAAIATHAGCYRADIGVAGGKIAYIGTGKADADAVVDL